MFGQRNEDMGTLTERTCLEEANPKLTLRSQRETFQEKCLQMVMGWGGLSWGWKSPSGSLILASCLFFGFSLVSCFSQHSFGGVGSSISSPDYPNLFSRCCFFLLVSLRIYQRVSLFLSNPDALRNIFIRKYEHKSRTLIYHIP